MWFFNAWVDTKHKQNTKTLVVFVFVGAPLPPNPPENKPKSPGLSKLEQSTKNH